MNQNIATVVITVLAVLGVIWLIEQLTRPRFVLQPAPIINVTVNLPETESKELTAGDHVKELAKLAWNNTCGKIFGS